MDGLDGQHQVFRLTACTGLIHERLNVGDIAAEVTHDGEGMGEECLCMRVRHLPAGVAVNGIDIDGGTVKANLGHCVNLFTDAAVSNQLVCLECGFGEVVVEVTAEVQTLTSCKRDHIACFFDGVGNRLFNEDVATHIECFDRGIVVPGTVFKTGGCDMNNFDFGMCREHILQRIVCGNAELGCRIICTFASDIADSNEFCQRIVLDAVCMGITDAAHTDDAGLKNLSHNRNPFCKIYSVISATRIGAPPFSFDLIIAWMTREASRPSLPLPSISSGRQPAST